MEQETVQARCKSQAQDFKVRRKAGYVFNVCHRDVTR